MAERQNKQTEKHTPLTEMILGSMMPGVKTTRDGMLFTIWADMDSEVSLILYDRESKEVLKILPVPADPDAGSWRSVLVSDLKPEQIEYNYMIDGEVQTDPAARLIAGRTPFGAWDAWDKHAVRSVVLPDKKRLAFRWDGYDHPLRIPYEEVFAYHLHVRGFTAESHSGVRAKGTFKGLAEKIPYLKKLGINQLILMPVYEFAELEQPKQNRSGMPAGRSAGQQMMPDVISKKPEAPKKAVPAAKPACKLNYWGYTKANYYAPKAAYSSTAQPDKEFMELVKALHKAGIEIVLEMAFGPEVPADDAMNILIWWAYAYHVDGFHLMAAREITDAAASSPYLKGVKLMADYFEPARIYGDKKETIYRNLANFNDGFKVDCRRFLKGDENTVGMFAERCRTNHPLVATMNYITGHDGFTLHDLVSYDEKHNEENGEYGRDGAETEFSWNCGEEGPTKKKKIKDLRMRQMKNAMTMLMLAQGTPVLLAGDERCNTQGGNNNPYGIDSETTWIDWKNTAAARELTEYIGRLAAFRKNHPMLHRKDGMTGQRQNKVGYPDLSSHSSNAWAGAFEYQNRHLGLMYCGTGAYEGEYIYIAYNMHWDEKEFALPKLPKDMYWQVEFATDKLSQGEGDTLSYMSGVRSFTMQGRTIAVLTGKSE